MLKKIIELNDKKNLIENGDNIVVGFSGGPDSVFLVEMLLKLKKDIKFELILVHINHMLRGKDADADEEFSITYAKNNNLKIFHKKIDIKLIAKNTGKSLEEVGREERYKFFNEVYRQTFSNKIATAHNKDDQIETFLFRLIRGTSLQGLEGIKIRNSNLIRPISEIYKADILDYLNKNQIQYRIDKTNFENEFTRNSIRLDLIPFIENRYNNKFKDKIFSLIQEIRENNKTNFSRIENVDFDNLKLSEIEKMPLSDIKNIIAHYLNKNTIKINRKKIEDISDLIFKKGYKKFDLTEEYELIKKYDKLYIQKREKVSLSNNEVEILVDNFNSIQFNSFKILIKIYKDDVEKNDIKAKNKYLLSISEEDLLNKKIIVRFRKDGDKIYLNNFSKKLKEIFINKKIDKDKRDFIPVFLYNDKIFWIYGVLKGVIKNEKNINSKLINILITVEEV